MQPATTSTTSLTFYILYNLLRFFCLPFFIFGMLYTQLKALLLCKYFQISYTATHALSIRWFLDHVSFRDDPGSKHLVDTLPMMSKRGLILVFLADIIWYRLLKKQMPYAGLFNNHYITQRTLEFDNIVLSYEGDVEQIISFGAGFDTRCLTFSSSRSVCFFDCDLPSLLAIKKQTLLKLGHDTSSIYFVPIDLRTNTWIQTLCDHGFSVNKKTLLLLEGLTPYLSHQDLLFVLDTWTSKFQQSFLLAFDIYKPSFLNSNSFLYQLFINLLLSFCKEPFQWLSHHNHFTIQAMLTTYQLDCLDTTTLSTYKKHIADLLVLKSKSFKCKTIKKD
tara:strand:+ start:1263 stop:2261 length:999 start_codon:yes stop_codon:yes gene_type:complete